MFRFFLDQRRRTVEGGFTLIELVVVLAILGILLALAVPRYLGARKRAYKAEVDHIMSELKTLSWAYYHENDIFPTSASDIPFQMPGGGGLGSAGCDRRGERCVHYLDRQRPDRWVSRRAGGRLLGHVEHRRVRVAGLQLLAAPVQTGGDGASP